MKQELAEPALNNNSNINSAFNAVLNDGYSLFDDLVTRFEPLIVQLQPIWSDPLWQFLGAILAIVICLIILFWVLRWVGGGLAAFAEGIKNILFSGIAALWKIIFSSPNKEKDKSPAQNRFWLSPFRIKQAFDTARYLTTRRDWRYQSYWYLLTGQEPALSRSAWINDVQQGRRSHLLAREKKLVSDGSGWHFFDHGVVIDIEDDSDFTQGVELLNSYRPERPLDGIILTLSAKQLLAAQESTATLHEFGQNLYQKMWTTQKITGFILPVYLVVTDCEAIEGFSTFWNAWSNTPADDMFGWSNPSRVDAAFSLSWIDDAFNHVIEAIRKAQLAIAATGEAIDNIDRFMLFDREFQTLQAPLTEVIEHSFASSSFQEALPLRGIWFSGNIGGQVSLSEDLFSEKIWPEKHLAHPVEQRFFSSNKTLRKAQYVSVIIGALLAIGLIIDAYRLYNYTYTAQKSWDAIFNNSQFPSASALESNTSAATQANSAVSTGSVSNTYSRYCHSQGIETWRLLNNLTLLDDQPTTLTIPFSWGGGQIHAMRQAAAESVFPSILFPAYECRLHVRAQELTQLSTETLPRSADLKALSEYLTDYTEALSAYQTAQTQFIRLAGPLPDTTHVVRDLRQLTDYLYDGTIPASIDFGTAIIVGGVMDAHYDIEWKANDLVDATDQANYLVTLSTRVSDKINEAALSPPLDDIRRAFLAHNIDDDASNTPRFSLNASEDMLASINTFQEWLRYISQAWLSSNAYNSPCGHFHQRMSQLADELSAAGYPKLAVNTAAAEFSETHCDATIRRHLVNLNVSPFGQLFADDGNGNITYSSQLNRWVDEFTALESLSLLSYDDLLNAKDEEVGQVIAWNTAPLGEAIDAVLEFQRFSQQWWTSTTSSRSEPFYAPALRDRLRAIVKQLVNKAQVREYTQSPLPITRTQDREATMSASIVSFERAESMIRQLTTLLHQTGDATNATELVNQTNDFVYQQLDQLTEVTGSNRLYVPLQRIDWKSDNLAQALFDYSNPVALANYLDNQRQRLSFLAQNYAKPLVSYLIDSTTIAETKNNARLWYNTLIELTQYDRQQPANTINQLQQYVAEDLGQQTWAGCEALLEQPQLISQGGLFSQRHYDIDSKVRYVCKNYGKNRVVRQYFALAERFNQDLKGRFPFADINDKPRRDLALPVLHRFLDDYQTTWGQPAEGQPLRTALKRYLQKNPNSGLDHWLRFVKQVDQFANFYQQIRDKDTALVNLRVAFDGLVASSKGQDQIIEWQLLSGDERIIFPNGDNRIRWQAGDDLSLSLRWANGSVFTPLASADSKFSVSADQRMAHFRSTSQWALFEWAQQFSHPSTKNQTWLEFLVPVTTANQQPLNSAKKVAYTSRIHLGLQLVIMTESGSEKYIAVPVQFPKSAPGLPGGDQ
ncbi:type VI secretion system protein [Eionea flava]